MFMSLPQFNFIIFPKRFCILFDKFIPRDSICFKLYKIFKLLRN